MRDESGLAPVAAVATAIALLASMDAVMKGLMDVFPLPQAVFLRYVAGLVVALPVYMAARAPIGRRSLIANGLRSFIVIATATSFFYAISALPLADVIAIAFLAPFFMALLGRLLLGESVAPRVAAGILVGFAGVLAIVWGELGTPAGTGSLGGVAAALAAAFFYALANVLLRKQSAYDTTPVLVMLQTAFAALLAAPFGIMAWKPLSTAELGLFAAAGLAGTLGHLALAWGFSRAKAARLGVLEYTGFLWASLFGFVFFAETPKAETVAGAALIIGACLVALRPEKAVPAGRATARGAALAPPEETG